MKRSVYVGILVSLLSFLAVSLSCCLKKDVEKIYRWKMHTYVPESISLYQGYMLPLIQELKTRTNGRLQITPYPVNAIVAPSDLLVATSEGVVECAMATAGYDTGIIPEAHVAQGLPYAWGDISQPSDFWYNTTEAWDILEKAYQAKNIKLAALLSPDDPLVFLTMFPIEQVSDFKGKLIRSSGSWSSIVSNTGASQVSMSISDVYQSLEKGVIDGTFMTMSGLSDFKWDEIIKYVLLPPVLLSGSASIIVNLDAFNELTPELQKIFIDTVREMNMTHMVPYTGKLNERTIAAAKEKGVEFVTLSEAGVTDMYHAALDMWKEVTSINENTEKQVALLKEYLDARGVDYPGKQPDLKGRYFNKGE